MLFCNISSDKVQLLDTKKEQFLERNGIEDTLGPVLFQYNKKHSIDSLFLLNWPGGFTNLRVGTLVLNLFNKVLAHDKKKPVPIFSITKLDLYKYAFKKWRVPRYGIIYIGQRNNVWKSDFKTGKYTQITLDKIDYREEFFLDFVQAPYRKNKISMISFSISKGKIACMYKKKNHLIDIEDLGIKPTLSIQPEYLIGATK